MEIVRHDNVESLLGRCAGILERQEALNNNLIQLLDLIANDSELLEPPYCLGTIEENGVPVGCFVSASPDGLVISDLPEIAVSPLRDAILEEKYLPGRIVGEPKFTNKLIEQLQIENSHEAVVSSKWKVYRLDKVTPLTSPAAGFLREATPDDEYLVEQWGHAYGDEKPAFLNVHDFLLAKLHSNEMYFWDDENPRTMITTSGKHMNAKRISSVFTPNEYRGRGYATTGVTAMSDLLLSSGAEYVVLTAGLDEPAARIYQRIGFTPVGKRQSYVLKRRALRPSWEKTNCR